MPELFRALYQAAVLTCSMGLPSNVEHHVAMLADLLLQNEWQSFRRRQNRGLELSMSLPTDDRPGRYAVAVKVIEIVGNDTMMLVPVNVGWLRDGVQEHMNGAVDRNDASQ